MNHTEILKNLKEMRAFYTDENKWKKGRWSCGVARCLEVNMGCVMCGQDEWCKGIKRYGSGFIKSLHRTNTYIFLKNYLKSRTLWEWNDGHTFEQVCNALDAAIEFCEIKIREESTEIQAEYSEYVGLHEKALV